MQSLKVAFIIAIGQWLSSRIVREPFLNMLALLFFAGLSGPALASEDVPFKELGGDQCFMFSRLFPYRLEGDHYVRPPIELVINDEESFLKLFAPEIRRQSCDDVDPSSTIPKVDFSKQTVLGLWSSGSCADKGFEKRVVKDDDQKWLIYSVTIIGADIFCSGNALESLNLIAIPKVPVGYKVYFESSHK